MTSLDTCCSGSRYYIEFKTDNPEAYRTVQEICRLYIDKEKQIPKRPRKEIWVDDEKRKGDVRLATKDDVLTKDNHGTITHCPNCDEWVTVQKYLSPPKYDLFCRNCGQALDWSDKK